MKTRILIIICFFSCFHSFAQKKKDKNTDNYNYIKLYITNADNKILLLKWDNSWEVPGARYSAPYTLSKFIDTLAAEDGIKVKDVKLSGMFTVEYEGQKRLAVMQYYSATHSSGNVRVPAGCADIQWFSVEEALKILTFEDMKIMIRQINEDPKAVWGGAIYKRTDKQTNMPIISVQEPFYKLN